MDTLKNFNEAKLLMQNQVGNAEASAMIGRPNREKIKVIAICLS